MEYTGYVAHVCDMKSYFDENMKLLDEKNLDALFPKNSPVYTKIRDDNPTRYVAGSKVSNSLLPMAAPSRAPWKNCVLFRGVKVKKGAVIRNCVLMQDTVVEKDVRWTTWSPTRTSRSLPARSFPAPAVSRLRSEEPHGLSV